MNDQESNTLQAMPIEKKIVEFDTNKEVTKTVKSIKRFGIELEVAVPRFGRPSVMTEEVIELLAEAWLFGCSDEEACTYAGIAPKTLYNFQSENEEFLQYKEHLKTHPILKARMTLYRNLDDPVYAWKFLNKKAFDLQDIGKGGDVQLNVQLNQFVEEDRKRE